MLSLYYIFKAVMINFALLLWMNLHIVLSQCDHLKAGKCYFYFQTDLCLFQSCLFASSQQISGQALHSQIECLKLCCIAQDTGSTPYNGQKILKSCLERIEEDSLLGLILGFSIGIPFTLLLIYILYRRLPKLLTNNDPSRIYDQYTLQPTIKQTPNKRDDKNQSINLNSSEYLYDRKESVGKCVNQSVMPVEQNLLCSICLEKGVTAQTVCGHKFHHTCLVEWLCRSKNCPECRSTGLNNYKVWCYMCLRQQSFISYSFLPDGYLCKWCKVLS